MKLTSIAGICASAFLLVACQTTSGPSAGAISRLESAGFTSVPGFSSLKLGEVSVQTMMICTKATCVPPSLVAHLSGPDRSPGLGGTLEEAIRAGKNRQVADAIRKQLKSDRNFQIQSVQPYVADNQARIRLTGRYLGTNVKGNALVGEAVVQANIVNVTMVTSPTQAIASQHLNIAMDRQR